MSEYQRVIFRAVDGPVSDKNLEYMQRQSTRAQITRWSFTNEYHFGDFHGNAVEMLRCGYDIHLHYANYGIRRLYIRLPHGFPDTRVAKPYLNKQSPQFIKDKQGSGGTLAVEPYIESGELDELYELDELLERLIPLRAEIISGDLRPLYLAHLASLGGDDHDPDSSQESPVPAGLGQPTPAQLALAELYGISDALIQAAAREAFPAPSVTDSQAGYLPWLRNQSDAVKNAWLAEVMADPNSHVRATLLAEYRRTEQCPSWPVTVRGWTLARLQEVAAQIQVEFDQKKASAAARAHARKLAKMVEDPTACLKEVDQLVNTGATSSYEEASKLLAELRTALADTRRAELADNHARKLHQKHPTLNYLTRALRSSGFIPKVGKGK